MAKPDKPVLRASEYVVEPIPLAMGKELVAAYHYAKGAANTAVARHGLFHRDDFMTCLGSALWMPPTENAGRAWWPSNPQGVLTLSRLVVDPSVPQNGASFLIARSVKLIRQDPRWECLLTYADEAEGHTGAIYRAGNWEYLGMTEPRPRWVDSKGQMVAVKATVNRTVAEMLQLGYRIELVSQKHRFRMVLRPATARTTRSAA